MSDPVQKISFRSVGLILGLCAALLLLSGCGKRLKPAYPVSGKVFVGADKKPATGAFVVFHPVKTDDGDVVRPMAEVDDEGRFALTTRKANDGAPAGDYTITIVWHGKRKSLFEPEEDDRFEGAYADPKASNFRFTVHAGPNNEVPVIELP